ncbi:MAG: toll/interleukin-1 receptor domain-containing protein [Chloroflexota bacterium]
MKLFISWSGQLSQEVAEVLHKYLPLMLQGVDVFMSKNDIESGVRWGLELAKELEESQFGIICLTPDNFKNPWILFEAGALTKHIEGRACGLLLGGLKPVDISGPLTQFQHRIFNQQDFFVLVRDINQRHSNPLGESQLNMVVQKWWPDIDREYQEAIEKIKKTSRAKAKRPQEEMVEEVLLRVRGIERSLGIDQNWSVFLEKFREFQNEISLIKFDKLPFDEKWNFINPKNITSFLKSKLDLVLLSLSENQRRLLFELAQNENGKVVTEIDNKYLPEDIAELSKMSLIMKNEKNYKIHSFFISEIKNYAEDINLIKSRREIKKKETPEKSA